MYSKIVFKTSSTCTQKYILKFIYLGIHIILENISNTCSSVCHFRGRTRKYVIKFFCIRARTWKMYLQVILKVLKFFKYFYVPAHSSVHNIILGDGKDIQNVFCPPTYLMALNRYNMPINAIALLECADHL